MTAEHVGALSRGSGRPLRLCIIVDWLIGSIQRAESGDFLRTVILQTLECTLDRRGTDDRLAIILFKLIVRFLTFPKHDRVLDL